MISLKECSPKSEADNNAFSSRHRAGKPSLTIQIPTAKTRIPPSPRSPFIVPIQLEPFAESFRAKNAEGDFLGRAPLTDNAHHRRQYGQIRRVARFNFSQGVEALEPSPEALERTQEAAKAFFQLSYLLLEHQKSLFPLAGRNKCLGMVAVPNTKLAIIAISQDKDPSKDERLRHDMVVFLRQLNRTSKEWIFELACIPTKAQYLMPRTLSMRAPHPAPDASVKPHTRCVEVALMAALCKAGRTINFTATDTGIIAFGGTLWASQAVGKVAIPHFEGMTKRNDKYLERPALEVELSSSMKGWVDIWEPCPDHCKIYKYEMLAIGSSGGFSGSFFEPRSEGTALKQRNKAPVASLQKNYVTAGMALGLSCCLLGVSCESTQGDVSKMSLGAVTLFVASALFSVLSQDRQKAKARPNTFINFGSEHITAQKRAPEGLCCNHLSVQPAAERSPLLCGIAQPRPRSGTF